MTEPIAHVQSSTGAAIPIRLAAQAYRKPTEKPVEPKQIKDEV